MTGRPPLQYATLVGALVAFSVAAAAGEVPAPELYQLHCSGCHGAQGGGIGTDFPSLRAIAPLAATPEGRKYLVRVPGVAQASIGSDDLARLLDWIVVEMAGSADHRPYAADEVEALRRTPLRDPLKARAAIVPARP